MRNQKDLQTLAVTMLIDSQCHATSYVKLAMKPSDAPTLITCTGWHCQRSRFYLQTGCRGGQSSYAYGSLRLDCFEDLLFCCYLQLFQPCAFVSGAFSLDSQCLVKIILASFSPLKGKHFLSAWWGQAVSWALEGGRCTGNVTFLLGGSQASVLHFPSAFQGLQLQQDYYTWGCKWSRKGDAKSAGFCGFLSPLYFLPYQTFFLTECPAVTQPSPPTPNPHWADSPWFLWNRPSLPSFWPGSPLFWIFLRLAADSA